MSSLPQNPTPEQIARIRELNERLYKKKPNDEEMKAAENRALSDKAKAADKAAADAKAKAVLDAEKAKATENPALSDKAKAKSDDEKAKQAKELAAKIKANTPQPAPPSRTANRPFFQNQRLPIQPPTPPRPPMMPRPPADQPGMAVQAKVPPMPMGALKMSVASGPSQPNTDKMSMAPVAGDFNPSSFGGGKSPPMDAGYMKKGGKVKASSYKSGGNVSTASSASKRGDGIAQRGKTKGRMC